MQNNNTLEGAQGKEQTAEQVLNAHLDKYYAYVPKELQVQLFEKDGPKSGTLAEVIHAAMHDYARQIALAFIRSGMLLTEHSFNIWCKTPEGKALLGERSDVQDKIEILKQFNVEYRVFQRALNGNREMITAAFEKQWGDFLRTTEAQNLIQALFAKEGKSLLERSMPVGVQDWLSVEKDGLPEWGKPLFAISEFLYKDKPKTEMLYCFLDADGECVILPTEEDYGWKFAECITHYIYADKIIPALPENSKP